ncbi:MAG TPA: ATP-dependent Clp protease adaptor ClpS [Myxococcota bacterium]|jgi:ATP-dependent Clp protease adaptor protein ClpS|nr:ATP-dependent Clp protease adaptor ClpS [Myxococcota bacterium]
MAGERERKPQRDGGLAVETRKKAERKLARPSLYRVLLHNDDYTTQEFVVEILQTVFNHTSTDAVQIMLHVHTKGLGVAGVYPFEIAETKVALTMALAEAHEFPLLVTMEPD